MIRILRYLSVFLFYKHICIRHFQVEYCSVAKNKKNLWSQSTGKSSISTSLCTSYKQTYTLCGIFQTQNFNFRLICPSWTKCLYNIKYGRYSMTYYQQGGTIYEMSIMITDENDTGTHYVSLYDNERPLCFIFRQYVSPA